MSLEDSDKEWLALTLENAALKAHARHMEVDHKPVSDKLTRIDDKITSMTRFFWSAQGGQGLLTALLAAFK